MDYRYGLGPNSLERPIGRVPYSCMLFRRYSKLFRMTPPQTDLSSRETLRGRPISLSRVDGHALWLSPQALELTLAELPDHRWPSNDEIEGGEIMRDAHGNPTGT